jgi:hypothetical protein
MALSMNHNETVLAQLGRTLNHNETVLIDRRALPQITYNHNETVLTDRRALPALAYNHNETVLADADRPPTASRTPSLVRRGAVALAAAGLLGGALGTSGSPGLISSSDGFGSSPGVAESAVQAASFDQEMDHG